MEDSVGPKDLKVVSVFGLVTVRAAAKKDRNEPEECGYANLGGSTV